PRRATARCLADAAVRSDDRPPRGQHASARCSEPRCRARDTQARDARLTPASPTSVRGSLLVLPVRVVVLVLPVECLHFFLRTSSAAASASAFSLRASSRSS